MEFVINNGVLEKCRYYGEVITHLEIPQGVTQIGVDSYMFGGVFSNMRELETVVLPEGVTKISAGAFRNCVRLRQINLPDGLVIIGSGAFTNCAALKEIRLPESLQEIGDMAFSSCAAVEEMIIPDNVAVIGSGGFYVAGAFSSCRSLKTVKLSKQTTKIPRYMFLNCPQLTKVETASPLASVGTDAFGGCGNLKEISLAEDADIADGAFYGCRSLADEKGVLILADTLHGYFGQEDTLVIPDTIQKIGRKAFYQNKTLTCVTIPKGITEIGEEAFLECENLQNIQLPQGVTKLGSGAFKKCTSLTELQLPKSLKSIPAGMVSECTALKHITLSDEVKEIAGGAFYGCTNLTYIRIPETAKKVEAGLSKANVFVPEHIFGSYAEVCRSCYWNLGTTLYTIASEGMPVYRILLNDKIGKFVFDKKNQFSMRTYDSVLEANDAKLPVGLQALAMVYRLKYPQELTEERKSAFTAVICKQVKKVAPYLNAIPEDELVTVLEQIGAVNQKTKKSILVLAGLEAAVPVKKKEKKEPEKEKPKTLAQIKKEWSFTKLDDGTVRLDSYKGEDTHVEIPAVIGADPVSEIASCCFIASWSARIRFEQRVKRQKIVSVTIPEGIRTIESDTFTECAGLETVNLPGTLQRIKRHAFLDCVKLKNLNLSDSMEVEPAAFEGCRSMAGEDGFLVWNGTLHGYFGEEENVTVPDGVKVVSTHSFNNCVKLKSVTLSDTVTNLKSAAFLKCKQLNLVTFPAGIQSLGFGIMDWCGYGATFRGYTGTEVETYAANNHIRFESIGIVEKQKKPASDFMVSEYGVLTQYSGSATEVVIPEGVKYIGAYITMNGKGIFEGNLKLQKVVIPEGVIQIYPNAFVNCSNLEEIVFPDSLMDISSETFRGTSWLENQKQEQIYAGKVMIRYNEPEDAQEGELREVVVREGTTAIGRNAFGATKSRLRVILPEGIKCLNNYAFEGCTNLTELMVPAGLENIGSCVFQNVPTLKRCWGGVLHTRNKLEDSYTRFYTGEPDDSAWLLFYQTDKWKKRVHEKLNESPEMVDLVLKSMMDSISAMEKPEAALGNKAAALAMKFCKSADKQVLESLLKLLKEKKLPAAKKLEKDTSFVEALNKPDEDFSQMHPVEAEIFRGFKPTPVFENVLTHISEGVCYAGETEVCAPRVIAYIVSEYIKQSPKTVNGVFSYEKVPQADAAAGKLDQSQLLAVLADLTTRYAGEYSVPYARYADERNVTSLLSIMRGWDDWYTHGNAGRQNIATAKAGLLLSDTKAAAMYFDKAGLLDSYAALRGMDAQTFRDTVLSEFGFDNNRELRYDLGGNVIVVKLEKDLQLSLFDTNAGKLVKSVPKKNADAALHEKAKKEISAMRKNIKKVLTNRRDLLFRQFLTGECMKASAWKQVYEGNPVLRSMAQLLVWVQDGTSFLLTDTGTITADGAAYSLGEGSIALAHPMQMRQTELTAWQRYFTANGIRQPFEQIWESVADLDHLQEDRYAGALIPYYRFAGQDKHGIHVEDMDFHNEIVISFDDCTAKVERIDWLRHMIEMDNRFDVRSIRVNTASRAANHIIAYLDKATIVERIKKDDITIASSLNSFTLAQIMEFIHVAAQENCANVTALLLEYKNQHFANLDPMEEFSLEL